MSLRIVFFGSPEFAVPFFEALCDEPGYEVVGVVTQPDKPAGRGNQLAPSPVKTAALTRGVSVHQFGSLRGNDAVVELSALNADVFVVVAYGLILPQAVLDLPRLGCVNVHPSLLPKYRGPSPMQWAIAEGDAETGITIMKLDSGMDTGPLLGFETLSLDDNETLGTLTQKVALQGPRVLVQTLTRYAAGEITPMPQNEAQATLTSLLDRVDGHIDWTQPLANIEQKIRAYEGWPGTYAEWVRDERLTRVKIHKAQASDLTADRAPGTVEVRGEKLLVECGDGTLELLVVQPEGKPRMDAQAFLRGHADIDGARLT